MFQESPLIGLLGVGDYRLLALAVFLALLVIILGMTNMGRRMMRSFRNIFAAGGEVVLRNQGVDTDALREEMMQDEEEPLGIGGRASTRH